MSNIQLGTQSINLTLNPLGTQSITQYGSTVYIGIAMVYPH